MKVFRLFVFSSLIVVCTAMILTACEKKDDEENANSNPSGQQENQGYRINLSSGLVLYYTFDGSNCADKSGNSRNGIAQGEITYTSDTPTRSGKALMLDGTQQQYVNIPYQPLAGQKAYAVSLWAKNFGPGPLFAALSSGGLNSPSLYVTSDSKLKPYYFYDYNRGVFNTSLTSFQSSGWHHIVVTAQDQGEVVLYIDGTKMDSQAAGDVRCDGTKMQIGGNADGKLSAWADPIMIDNARVYSRSLTEREVSALYQAEGGISGTPNKASTTRGLLGYYTFDNNTADNTYLTGNNGILMGDDKPTFISDTPNGKGKALEVLSAQYVNFPENGLAGKYAFSIGLWVKNFGTGPLFATLSSGGFNSPSLYVTSDSKLKPYYFYDYNRGVFNTSLTSFQSSGWHHIVVTAQDQGEVVLYIDGTKMDSQAAGDVRCNGTKMQIGGNADGKLSAWADPMRVDNVRIHSVALTEAEVKAIYDSEK